MSLFRHSMKAIRSIRSIPWKFQPQQTSRISIPITSIPWRLSIAKSQSPTRCIWKLQEEHSRLIMTMNSWETMLDDLHQESMDDDESMTDLSKFLSFITTYQVHHHQKEDRLYDIAIDSGELDPDISILIIETTKIEHIYVRKMKDIHDAMHQHNISHIVSESKMFINEMSEHMEEENTRIYPEIAAKLNELEMEKASQELEQRDVDNSNTIKEMEILSDELNEKYYTKVFL